MSDRELFEKLIATMERLEKTGTLEKFYNSVKEENMLYRVDMPYISEEHDYKDIRDDMYFRTAMSIQNAEKEMGKAKFYMSRTKSLYDTYKPNEKIITNPDILKFIKDYEEDIGIGGEE